MTLKRKQYHINQYNFSDLKVNEEHLLFSVEDKVEHQNSENILFTTIYRILDKKFTTEGKNTLDEIFILNASELKSTDDEQIALYERLMSEGAYIDNVKYIRFGKSSSMAMNQRTLFVKEDLHDTLKEYISLGKTPSQTVISKYETALGLTLSSLNLVEGLPRIAIVKDFEKIVTDDVKMVTKFKVDDNDPKYLEYKKQVEFEELYKTKLKEVKEEFTSSKIRESFPLNVDSECKAASRWNRENRRVKMDQLDKPEGYKVLKNENKAYMVYSEAQTEELPNLINKYSLGYDIKVVENHPNEIVPFDGQGLISMEYAEKLSKKLKLNYVSNGFQIRMPYVKGLVINFDIKTWFQENGVTHISDLWGNLMNVNDIDMILTESCFKAKLEALEGKNKWLFSSAKEYMESLVKYGHNYIGIANHVKSVNENDIYTSLNYQFINSLNLTIDDIMALSKKQGKMLMDILKRGDTAAVKAFLNMTIRDNDKDRLDTDIQKVVDIDARMIFDPRVQTFLRNRVLEALKDMLKGRIQIKANYRFITGDCIAFMEYVSGKTVKGFLNKDEFYCNGVAGENVMMRNPLTSWHEVKKGQFIQSDNKYLQHLDNVVQLNCYDLTMPQLSGADVDGDKIMLTNEPLILKAVLDDLVIVNDDDKTTAKAFEYNMENIINFELKNLSNMTPVVTNINTLLQSYALEKGDLRSSELAIATCKQLQAEFIDSVKKGTNPQIPEVLLDLQDKKPYFQKFIYEDLFSGRNDYKYLNIYSPLNRFSMAMEERVKQLSEKRYFLTEYLDISTYDLITDMSKVDNETFFNLVDKITPIYNDFAKKKGNLHKEENGIKKTRSNQIEKEQLKVIKQKFKELYQELRQQLNEVCDNPSVLTTVCAYIGYKASKGSNVQGSKIVRTKSYLLPWICTENATGLLENVKSMEKLNKIDVREVPQLNRRDKEYEGLLIVEDGVASCEDVEFDTDLTDGKYPLFNQMGYHFIDYDNSRFSNVETSESEEIKVLSTKPLPKLDSYKCRLVGMNSGFETNLKLSNKVITLGENGNYLGIFLEDEYICGIAQENYESDIQKVFLKDYVGDQFKVKVEKEGRKSLTVNLLSV
ncbi:hypothetical protein [Sutcliffiella cohnii]|uniref:hypothetical protein n=1 Tax=Sutcliffiella cohnii TaxID=33932 RepID=UPI002E1A8FF3|nr:hypothetical protein [Sutcliffiella cohnii]